MGAYDDDDYNSELTALTSEPHFPLGHVLLQNAPLLRAMGLADPSAQQLGRGAFGAAYDVPLLGRSVLKFTRDPTEVQAASLLAGRVTERIVPVHGIWYVRNTHSPGLRRWYLVHRGYLHPLVETDKALVELLFGIYDDVRLDLVIPRGPKQHAMIAKWRGYVRDTLMDGNGKVTDEEGNAGGVTTLGTGKAVKRSMQLLLQIGSAIDEMHRLGIDWEDFHSDNLMRNDAGRLIIADIGWGLMHDDFDAEIPALDLSTITAALQQAQQ